MVGILPDQLPAPEGGDFAPFYGLPALTMTLVHSLIQRTGSLVVCGGAQRLDDGGFKLFFNEAPTAIYSEDKIESLTALNQAVEQCAAAAPAQYQWEYKRFRKQPDGVKRYYLKNK